MVRGVSAQDRDVDRRREGPKAKTSTTRLPSSHGLEAEKLDGDQRETLYNLLQQAVSGSTVRRTEAITDVGHDGVC